jgi:hypothetical protein
MFESSQPQPQPRFRAFLRLPSLRGLRFKGTFWRLLAVLVPIFLFRSCMLTYVHPDEIGLR